MKAPSSKDQAPEKLPIPNSKHQFATLEFGVWMLEFVWSLALGPWCFPERYA
jgi:hypothetical protein